MDAFSIYVGSELKEEFSYKRTLNDGSLQALVEYAKATYGNDAELRREEPKGETVVFESLDAELP